MLQLFGNLEGGFRLGAYDRNLGDLRRVAGRAGLRSRGPLPPEPLGRGDCGELAKVAVDGVHRCHQVRVVCAVALEQSPLSQAGLDKIIEDDPGLGDGIALAPGAFDATPRIGEEFKAVIGHRLST